MRLAIKREREDWGQISHQGEEQNHMEDEEGHRWINSQIKQVKQGLLSGVIHIYKEPLIKL